MAKISMTPEQMRTRATEYDNQGESVDNTIVAMDGLLSALQEEWQGKASEAYASKYENELKPAFKEAVVLIEEIAKSLRNAADVTEQTDDSIARGYGQ